MSKKSNTCFYYVAMFALSTTILLMCVRTRYTMSNAELLKESIELNILAPPIGLNKQNFMFKEAFNMSLELNKDLKIITFTLDQI